LQIYLKAATGQALLEIPNIFRQIWENIEVYRKENGRGKDGAPFLKIGEDSLKPFPRPPDRGRA
jgi:hypothetical protein